MTRRLVGVVVALMLMGVLAIAAPALHPRRRLRHMVDEVTEHVDVPGVRDCHGVLPHRSECRRAPSD